MKRILAFLISFLGLLAIVLAVPSKPSTVNADTGPKPDMQIRITNLEKSDYIVAMAINNDRYFNYQFYDPNLSDDYYRSSNPQDLRLIYNTVTFPEGWHLCDIAVSFNDTSEILLKSGYRWPDDFVLTILNRANNKYYLTEETKTYAFHSYFKFDMKNYTEGSIPLANPIKLEAKYEYGKEIGEFFLRLAITLGIELLLALAFKFTKKSFIIIAITNAVTQVGLNVALNLTAFFNGKNPWLVIFYIFAEFGIVLVESIVFMKTCKRKDSDSKLPILLYTVAANVLSFGLGMTLWFII